MNQLRFPIVVGFTFLSIGSSLAHSQEKPQAANPPATSGQSSSKSPGKESSHSHDFLLKGTVFTNTAYAFPSVQIRLRRVGEKKFHWETQTNSRGEFAIRVPQGAEYELQVHSKGFADQNRKVDAKAGNLEEGIIFRMEPIGGKA